MTIESQKKFKTLKDLTRTSDCGFQQLWICIQHKKLQSLIICVAYRPPDIPTTCLRNELVPAYAHALTLGKDILIAGDLNCNMLVDCAESRILNMKVPRTKPAKITTRSYKNFDEDKFRDDVSLAPWDTVSLFEHMDDQVFSFNKLFLDVLERHAPLKTFTAKHQKSKVITAEIRDLMRERDNLLKRAHQSRNSLDWECYKALRREVKKKIRLSETQLIRNEINENKNNKTSVWKTIRRCLNPCSNSALVYSRDCLEIANEFNEFFTSVGENVAKQAK